MKYAFLGAGKMASALIRGLLRSGVCKAAEITASCPEAGLLARLASETGVGTTSSNAEAVASADIVLLCVKPVDAAAALTECGAELGGKLLISIAAGLTLGRLAQMADGCRVVRAMPNTAAAVGRSATAFACGPGVTEEESAAVVAVFSGVGSAHRVEESLLDAVTGLSGSGPAYFYLVVEALTKGGVAAGLSENLALELAIETMSGAAEMLATTGMPPAQLREMVTSPAGTTMAGLAVLESAGMRAAFAEAVLAASRRSAELSRA